MPLVKQGLSDVLSTSMASRIPGTRETSCRAIAFCQSCGPGYGGEDRGCDWGSWAGSEEVLSVCGGILPGVLNTGVASVGVVGFCQSCGPGYDCRTLY